MQQVFGVQANKLMVQTLFAFMGMVHRASNPLKYYTSFRPNVLISQGKDGTDIIPSINQSKK